MDSSIARRRRVLVAAGLDPDLPMTRVESYANEVWVGDEVVVRINHPDLPGCAPDRALVLRFDHLRGVLEGASYLRGQLARI